MTTQDLHTLFLEHPDICTDTRVNTPGSLFFALKGENFDGNRFARKAIETGSSFVIVDDPEHLISEQCILMDDVLGSLQKLANYHRKYLGIPVLAITGSNGKTTTKELCHAVLSQKYNTVSTSGNLNNHIGVPLTLLRATSDTELMVLEMGANHPNEIALLCEIAQPNYGIITNIGKAHLEGFGSFEGVIKAKKELYDYIGTDKGTLFVNSGNQLLMDLSDDHTRITYGVDGLPDVLGLDLAVDPYVTISVMSKIPGHNRRNEGKLNSNLPGRYNVENILAATAVGDYFEVGFKHILGAIGQFVPENNRSQVIETIKNSIILDAYNANPTSMEHAIKNFIQMPGTNKTLIIGDMRELGDQTDNEHDIILSMIDQCEFSQVILVGEYFNHVIGKRNYVSVTDTKEAIEWIKTHPLTGQQILIKGSRLIGLENIIKVL